MKLTAAIREEVALNVMHHGFNEEESNLKNREHELAEECYALRYPEKQLEALQVLGADYLYHSSSIYVLYNNDNEGVVLRFRSAPRLVASRTDFSIKAYTDLDKRVSAFVADRASTQQRRKKSYADTMAVLKSFTTTNALLASWPEITEFVPEEAPKAKNLPAVQLDQLNAELKLPPVPSA
jgi:hypothetical protein